jgi:GT2 family glycosyltransferase
LNQTLNLSSERFLALPGSNSVAWATFDAAWYRTAYASETAHLSDAPAEAVLAFYFATGQHRAHSPNRLFDEAWHRRAYPAMNALIEAGQFPSAFDAYCRGGCLDRSPHWLFDEIAYRNAYPDLTETALAAGGLVNGYDHYLWRGNAQGRIAHPFFNPAIYLANLPAAEAEDAAADGPFWHYLRRLDQNAPDLPTSTHFDPDWYRQRYPDVAEAIANGQWRCALEHYLCNDTPSQFDPKPEQDYRTITEAQAKTLFRDRARTHAVLTARTRLDFSINSTNTPALSVIIVLHNQFELTMMALGSLRANYSGEIELIPVDSGSTDETRHIQRYVTGAPHHIRFETNVGYLRGCNAALPLATANACLYLNNDIELAPGAIAAALRRLASDPQIGAVGGLVLRSNNVIQEAGNIIWRDGSTEGYLRDASPLAPEANFVRDVDFCSGVFLMTRRALLDQLQGLDPAYAPAYYEDTDLCRRIAHAGYRVVYDPAIVITHLEYGSAPSSGAAQTEIARARRIFQDKHAEWLNRRPHRSDPARLTARNANTTQRRILFVEDTVPLRMIGSGFVRSNDLIRTMASMGYAVTVYPLNGCPFEPAHIYADMPDTVEVMHQHARAQFGEFLAQRTRYYDVIWIARTHNFDSIHPILAQSAAPTLLIVLDTEAIASIRLAEQAALEDRPFDLHDAIDRELANADFADRLVATTQAEATFLHDRGFRDVTVIGHMRTPSPSPSPFAQRSGMLFVGAIHRTDSPNYDGLCWLIDSVMPLIEQALGSQTQLTIAGYIGVDVALDRFLKNPRVRLLGAVADLAPLYDSHRVFVAPTRFAAGKPYKVHEAASFGLPVVATSLLCRQLGWTDQRDLLAADAADPDAFAGFAVALQQDEALWNTVRENALQRLCDDDQQSYREAITGIIGPPCIGNLSEK